MVGFRSTCMFLPSSDSQARPSIEGADLNGDGGTSLRVRLWGSRILQHLSLLLSTTLPPALSADDTINTFVDRNCMDCHDAETKKGEFSLEIVFQKQPPTDRIALLEKIVRKVEAGEMPPKKKDEFFTSGETQAFLDKGRGDLLAYFANKKEDGFGGIQRLRSDQYVNTLQDLLGYPFRDIERNIPTDSPDHRQPGEISYYHLEKYVESAGNVVDYLIGRPPGEPKTYIFNFENAAKIVPWLKADHVQAPMSEEKGVLLAGSRAFSHQQDSEMYTAAVEQAGLYKIRAKVLAERGTVTFAIAARYEKPVGRNFGTKGSRRLYLGEAPEGKFLEVEIEAFVNKGEQVCVHKISIPGPNGYKAYKRFTEDGSIDKPGRGEVLWLHAIEAVGPIEEEIHSIRKKLLGNSCDNRDGVAKVIEGLLPRAFRRQTKATEVEPFLEVYDEEIQKSRDHDQALREALKAVFTSSQFLYRNNRQGFLDDYEIANRLSYFLWNSMPDDQLFDLASRGELQTPKIRAAQVERMLADEKSHRFIVDFNNYWLKLHQVGHMRPTVHIPGGVRFDATLKEDYRRETRLFFKEILDQDLSVNEFLEADWSMLNENMAKLYRMVDRGITGHQFRKVTFKAEDNRGGVVGQASFLNLTSFSETTRPIARGVWIIENLMGQHLQPPKGIQPIETDTRGAKTILEQIRKHRDADACRSCHVKIDPLGIGLEHYGVAGQWRRTYKNKLPIVTQVPEYSNVSGIEGIRELLMEDKDDFRVQLVNKLKRYALGRPMTYYDLDSSRRITRENGDGLKTLIKAIVADETFLIR